MSYIDENLMGGEKIIFRTKPHWIIFSNAIIWTIMMLISFIVFPFTTFGNWHLLGHKLYNIFGTLSFITACFTGIFSYIDYVSSEYGITNKRVLIKVGFIRRTSLEVLLSKIESIQVVQSILGRVFQYGTIVISGTGGSRDAYRNIPNPLIFRKITQEQVEHYEGLHK